MNLSTVILPIERWPKSREKWRRAEELGFHAAYTYDHLSWQRLENRPWFGAVPTLCAAAQVTSSIKIGTLVTSPNFRHPVPFAKDLLTIDDISEGRLVVGIGSGGTGYDATVLGTPAWSPRERAARFDEFVTVLDELLREQLTSRSGRFYAAQDARMLPGTIATPRPPFYIAATGPLGLDLTARFAQGWVAIAPTSNESMNSEERVRGQIAALHDALQLHQRHRSDVELVLLDGFSDERPLASVDSFVDWAGRYLELGINEIVIHWPEPESIFDTDASTFERITLEGMSQLRR